MSYFDVVVPIVIVVSVVATIGNLAATFRKRR